MLIWDTISAFYQADLEEPVVVRPPVEMMMTQ